MPIILCNTPSKKFRQETWVGNYNSSDAIHKSYRTFLVYGLQSQQVCCCDS